MPPRVKVPLRVFELIVPPFKVRASATSLSAQGLAVLTQLPDIVSFSDNEAGPPVPQSSLTIDSGVLKETLKWAAAKDKEAVLLKEEPVSLTWIYPVLAAPPISRAQEKVPVEEFQRSLFEPTQLVRPEPKKPEDILAVPDIASL